jgi:hypothetical protein
MCFINDKVMKKANWLLPVCIAECSYMHKRYFVSNMNYVLIVCCAVSTACSYSFVRPIEE